MVKRLPDGEFEVMKVVWRQTPPVSTLQIIENLQCVKGWKPQTVLTMLVRLIEKGFLASRREGRERNYTPLIEEADYMQIETGDFIKRYSGNKLGSLVKALYDGRNLSKDDFQELKNWLAEKADNDGTTRY